MPRGRQAAHRTMAILMGSTFVVVAGLQDLLQPEPAAAH
jgi:hypothetical protein